MEIRECLAELRRSGPGAFAAPGAPFLIEEGPLHQDTRRVGVGTTRVVEQTPAEATQEQGEVAADLNGRRVYRVAARDGRTDGDVSIGRGEDVDVRIDLSSVSKHHASIGPGPNGWVIRDVGSTNGTFLDGDRLPAGVPRPIASASVVRFGPEVRLTFLEPATFEHFLHQIAAIMEAAAASPAAVGGEQVAVTASKVLKNVKLPDYLDDDETARADPGAADPSTPMVRLTTRRTKRPKSSPPAIPLALECRPFPPLALVEGRPLTVGRVAGNDLILPHPSVSRRHALFERGGDEVDVLDLGSANGLLVEGKKLERATIGPGGVVVIGPYSLTVLKTEAQPPPEQAGGSAIAILGQVSLRGVLEDVPLEELLQGVALNRKTGVLEIDADDGTQGEIVFRGGEPIRATSGAATGEPAIKRLLLVRKGRFVMRAESARTEGAREVRSTFARILLESARERDETGR